MTSLVKRIYENAKSLISKNNAAAISSDLDILEFEDRFAWSAATAIKPADIGAAMTEAMAGRIQNLMDIFEEYSLKDGHLRAEKAKRERAVARIEAKLTAPDRADSRMGEIVDRYSKWIKNISGFYAAKRTWLEAPAYGFAAVEGFWTVYDGKLICEKLTGQPQRRFVTRKNGDFGLYTNKGDWINGEPLPGEGLAGPPKILIHQAHNKGSCITAGYMWPCTWYAMMKNFTLKDWLSFMEVFGFPFRHGKYPQGSSEDDKNILRRAILNMASNAGAITPDNQVIEFHDTNRTGAAQLFSGIHETLDAAMSKCILGSTLTTQTGAYGNRSMGEVHDDMRLEVAEEDALLLQEYLNESWIRPWIAYNEGELDEYPVLQIEVTREEDLNSKMTRDAEAVRIGVALPRKYFVETYGYPESENDDDAVSPPSNLAPGQANPNPDEAPSTTVSKKRASQGLPGANFSNGEFRISNAELSAEASAGIPGRTADHELDVDAVAAGAVEVASPAYEALLDAALQARIDGRPVEIAIGPARADLAAVFADVMTLAWLAGMEQVKAETGLTVEFAPLDESGDRVYLESGPGNFEFRISNYAAATPEQIEAFKTVRPVEEIKIWRRMSGVTPEQYAALEGPMKRAAWTVSGLESRHVLWAVDTGIDRALRDGVTEREFRKYVQEQAVKAGVSPLSNHQMGLAFRQNMFTARSAAREQAYTQPAVMKALKWWVYSAVMDERTRPEHAALNGYTAPAGSSSFPRPPIDFMCRCDWYATTEGAASDWPPAADNAVREGFGKPGDLLRGLAAQ